MRGRAAILFAALGVALGAPGAAAGQAPAPELLPLHAGTGPRAGIHDSAGRQVLLRGVNVNQLGDYFQVRSDLPATVPLAEADLGAISGLGMDVVRLIVHWSRLEPVRGGFSQAYLERIREAVDWARAHGIYVVLDMHQDAWGKHVATPPGERCAPGFSANQGWDGAPRWATSTDGLPTCRLGIREVSPAVAQAFESFWLDRDGIQAELARTWARLARAFAGDPAIAGYDLLNEPHPGYAVGVTDATHLGRFYDRAIDAIRAAEARAPGGFDHIVFFEPAVVWSGLGFDLTPPPGFTQDRNIVFAPHLYAESITLDRAILGRTVVSIETGFRLAALAASAYGTTVWSGEWGWFGDPAGDAGRIAAYARQEDEHLWGGAWWQWRQACGDPHNFADGRDPEPAQVSGNLIRYACPSQAPLPMPESTVRILSRPYPRAAPGRLVELESNPNPASFFLRGSDPDPAGSCRLEVWVPARGATPPSVGGRNVGAIAIDPFAGGWLVSGCARGGYGLRGSYWQAALSSAAGRRCWSSPRGTPGSGPARRTGPCSAARRGRCGCPPRTATRPG